MNKTSLYILVNYEYRISNSLACRMEFGEFKGLSVGFNATRIPFTSWHEPTIFSMSQGVLIGWFS